MLRIFFFFFGISAVHLSHAQVQGILTEGNQSAEDLIKDVFIKGNCRNVSNIKALGNENVSIGKFSNAGNILGFDEGIIISTGDIELAQGPNRSIDSGRSFDLKSQEDADLDILATDSLFDITGIEFDFIPIDHRVTFQYVFASEEYCEFVGTDFNDVFGFFVSGPGINGPFADNAINVARLINGAGDNVSINNVSHLTNTEFFINNATSIDTENCNLDFQDTFQDVFEYDGFTVRLAASFQVIPCETYRIRLVIGDVADSILDSAVFLQSESFDLGEKVNISVEVPGRDEPIAYENCVDGQIVFRRNSSSSLDDSCTVEYQISNSSTAINGVDFEEIPMSITIPSGVAEFVLPIRLIDDAILEGPENLQLEINYACGCIDPASSELIIDETPDVEAHFDSIEVCGGQAFYLKPTIDSGVEPFEFLWDTGATEDSIEFVIREETNVAVTITDFCGDATTAIAEIEIQNIPRATLSGTYDLCEIRDVGIPIEFEGNPPWSIAYSINGNDQLSINNIVDNPFFLKAEQEGLYELTFFEDSFCNGLAEGNATVEFATFQLETQINQPSCPLSLDGSIEIISLEAIPPFSIDWEDGTSSDNVLDDLSIGTYNLKIIDANGCLFEKEFELDAVSDRVDDCMPVYIPNSFSPNGDGINDVFSIYADQNAGIQNILSMQVYSKWGETLFEQRNFMPDNGSTGWDGKHRGDALNTGIYIYKLIIELNNRETLILSGDISLIR